MQPPQYIFWVTWVPSGLENTTHAELISSVYWSVPSGLLVVAFKPALTPQSSAQDGTRGPFRRTSTSHLLMLFRPRDSRASRALKSVWNIPPQSMLKVTSLRFSGLTSLFSFSCTLSLSSLRHLKNLHQGTFKRMCALTWLYNLWHVGRLVGESCTVQGTDWVFGNGLGRFDLYIIWLFLSRNSRSLFVCHEKTMWIVFFVPQTVFLWDNKEVFINGVIVVF